MFPRSFSCSGKALDFLLGAFAKMLKATISFVNSVYPSDRKEQLSTNCTDFH